MRKFLSLFIVLILTGVLAFAQTRVVTGRITDGTGAPVEGATIKVKGAKRGVAADANGNYSISVNPGAVLVISGVGLASQEVTVGSLSNVNINMVRTSSELTNVVVTAQGIRRQPKELGYSTARLSNNDVNQTHVTNIATGLAAKVSGLQINQVDNSVNPQTRITLRGNRSILGNNQALLVLDDVPVSLGYLNSINPNDIDNITVLKGASASALYGSEASNGVIIVTTKKGTKGKPVIRYSNTTQVQEIAFLPKFQNEYGQNGGEGPGNGVYFFPNDPFTPYVSYENQSFGPHFDGRTIKTGVPVRFYNKDGSIFRDSVQNAIYSAKPGAKKGFFDKGITEQNDFSISGGDDKSKFYFSVQDVDIKGTVPKDKNHRDAIRLNGTREFGKFSIIYSADLTATNTNVTQDPFIFPGSNTQGGGGYGSPSQQRPLYFQVIQTSPNIDLRNFKNWQTDPFANPSGYFNAYYSNPWWQIDASRTVSRQNDLLGTIGLNYKINSWVNLLARASVSHQDFNEKYTRNALQFNDYSISNPWGVPGYNPTSVRKLDAQMMDGFSTSNRITGDFIASAEKSFGRFTTRLILGSTVRDSKARAQSESAASLIIPDFFNISNVSGVPFTSESINNSRFIGAYGDLTLGYNDYLFLHGSVRNDWTSLLAQANRSFLYPSVDLSFVFTDAIPGLKGSKVLNFGKLRAAYSRTAQVSIGSYALQNVFNSAPGFPYGGIGGYTLGTNFANPDIKPEFTTEKEIGLELGFLNNRINFSAAYYHTLTNNQTIPISISSTTGGTSATINSGEMTNDGVELDLKFTPLKLRNGLRWDVGMNFTYIDNRVKSISPSLKEVNVGGEAYAIVGQPYPVLKVTDWLRDSATGKIIVDPVSGYPSLNNSGPVQVGTANPPYKLGLTTAISYKGFTLSGVADYRSGAVIDNQIGSDLTFSGVSAFSTLSGRQRFIIPNTVVQSNGKYVPNTNIATSGNAIDYWASTLSNAGSAGSTYVTSADFWKIRELALSYEFPTKMVRNLKFVKGINVSVVGRNLFTWTAKENLWTDPEFSNTTGNGTGVTNILQTPPTRIFGANLTVTF